MDMDMILFHFSNVLRHALLISRDFSDLNNAHDFNILEIRLQ